MKSSTSLLILFICCCFFDVLAQKTAPPPYGATPSKRQLAWHEVELYGLIHFTPTTFENKEWGFGDADPKKFNPSNFSAQQIVDAAKAGGLKAIILVAKHHDGFALWPTKTTDYNISKSPYKNGKADMVKEFETAARKAGLKFGVYCSPWDRNHKLYGTDKYLAIYQQQLTELYTNYGDIFMSWHDGANGGDGYYGGTRETRSIDNTTYYDWKNTWAITRKLQPMASIFSDIGPDVRWIGNEDGHAAPTSWATFTPSPPDGKNIAVPGQLNYPESPKGTRNGKNWIPAECDVPLRKGWFFHANEKPKTPEALFDLYLRSVGRGAGLDLGLAPDTSGRLREDDVTSLTTFGSILKKTFATNLAQKASIKASNVRDLKFSTKYLSDGDIKTYWATANNVTQASINLNFKTPVTFNIISLQEYIPLGQRIAQFNVEAFIGGKWRTINEGESIGAKRLIKLEQAITTKQVRINITKSPVALTLSEIGLYLKE